MRVALLVALLAVLLLAPLAHAAEVARAGSHVFHSSFWINLHDRLRHDAGAKDAKLDNKTWRDAVLVYRSEVTTKDFLFDPSMVALVNRLAQIPDDGEPTGDDAVSKALRSAAPLYRAKQWKEDDAINRFWISIAMTLLRDAGGEIAAELSKIYGEPWPKRLHIDVAFEAGRFGAYTPAGPPLYYTMVSSRDPGYQGFYALEMMFHEPLHHFDDRMDAMITAAMKRMDVQRAPRNLSHAILFYTAGELTRRALARRGVSNFKGLAYDGIHARSWPDLLPRLEEHWQAYLDGKITREAALDRMVMPFTKPK